MGERHVIAHERLFFFPEQQAPHASLETEGRVLDIGGGGEGVIGQILGDQVVAIDPNRRELEEAAPGPLKIVMDATDLQFLDGAFSVVTSFYTLMYIKSERLPQVFGEAFRVLEPGGRMLIWDTVLPNQGDREEEFAVFPVHVQAGEIDKVCGYGTRWPQAERDLTTYARLAQEAGFVVTEQAQAEDMSLLLDLQRPS